MVERNLTVSTDAAAAPEKAQITKRCVLRGLMAHALALDAAGRRPALVHVGANPACNRNDPRSLVVNPQCNLLRVVPAAPPRGDLATANDLKYVGLRRQLRRLPERQSEQHHLHQISAAKVSALKRKPVWFVKNAQISSLSKATSKSFADSSTCPSIGSSRRSPCRACRYAA